MVKVNAGRPHRRFYYRKNNWELFPFTRGFVGRRRFRRFKDRFSLLEIRSILVAWLVLAVAFGYVLYPILFSTGFVYVFGAAAIVLGLGFIFHELMHKFAAQRYGYDAEFRVWPFWLVFALIMAFAVGVVFAAPGATYFQPDPREYYMDPKGFTKRYGIISLAGPEINIVFGAAFLGLFYLAKSFINVATASTPGLFALLVFSLGAYINFYLAAFNMIPFGNMGSISLDGYKVWRWNRVYWALFFAVPVVITALIFLGYIPVVSQLVPILSRI